MLGLNRRSEWIRNRRAHLRQIQLLVDVRLAQDSEEIRSYERSYAKGLSSRWRPSTRSEMLEDFDSSRVIMVADFHAHGQSQRVIRRLLESMPDEWQVILAVEFFEADHQPEIEAFLADEISEQEFLSRIDWDGKWGFQWRHYREILNYARSQKFKVYGLNRHYPVETTRSMTLRDEFAADRIAEIASDHPDSKIVTVFGELHLASDRLPSRLESQSEIKKNEISIVYQNPEGIYFKLCALGKDGVVDVVKLRKKQYAIMGAPPWVQWQSYLMHLEQSIDALDQDLSLGEPDDFDDLEGPDVDNLVGEYIQLFLRDFDLEVDVDQLAIYSSQDESFWEVLQVELPSRFFKLASALMARNESLYLPGPQKGYLSQLSVNHVTSLAGHFVHCQVAKIDRLPWVMPREFEALVWYESVSFFFSKWVNPHRKAYTVHDLNLAARESEKGRSREVLLLALDQKLSEHRGMRRRKFRPRHKLSYFEAARILGGMVGEKLYYGYKASALPDLLNWVQHPLHGDDFAGFYAKVIEALEGIEVPYKSKKERF